MNQKKLFPLYIVCTLFLVACQANVPPERPLNNADRPRVNESVSTEDEILPVLKMNIDGTASEMKLRSQTARYLNSQKSQLEIVLTSSKLAYCQNVAPNLTQGEEEIKIIIKSKRSEEITKNELAGDNENYDINAIFKTAEGERQIPGSSFKSFKITDLNNAIVRGSLKVSSESLQIEGEYFTAICK